MVRLMEKQGAGAARLVLRALDEAGGKAVVAESLAAGLELTPEALFAAVRELRAQGYEIDSRAGQGYRLLSAPEQLHPEAIRALLSTRELGGVIHHHESLGSTNDEAARLAKAGTSTGTVVVADRQTAGRGRRGRNWISPPRANLLLSVILRPRLPPQRAPELVSVVAVAGASALRELGVPATIKWPNDLLVEGRKLAGILLDLSADAKGIHYVVAGIGINLNAKEEDLPEELRPVATSARQVVGAPIPRAKAAALLLNHLERWLDRFEAAGFAPIRERYRELSSVLGQPVRLLEQDRVVEGVAEDIDEGGALLVRLTDGSSERFLSGDLTSLRLSAGVGGGESLG